MATPTAAFARRLDPEHPGWETWDLNDPERFIVAVMGKLIVRREGDRAARIRMLATHPVHTNIHGNLHGGVTLALADIGMFAAANIVLGDSAVGSVTLDLNCQFLGLGRMGQSVDCITEVMKETSRLIFIRGTIEQDHGLIASFMGTLRKQAPADKATRTIER